MIVTDCKLYRYRIPLVCPLSLKSETYTARDGLILKLFDSEGNSGVGEIAPLPGYSRENLDQAEQQTGRLLRSLRDSRWESLRAIDDIDTLVSTVVQTSITDAAPSVEFGFVAALWTFLAARNGTPLFVGSTKEYVSINALLTGDEDTVLSRAANLREQGYTCFKLKVGGRTVDDDVRLVHQLRETLGDRCDLRLDANRAWGINDTLSFLKQVALCGIEHIEEPVATFDFLRELLNCGRPAVPIALDETLVEVGSVFQLEKLGPALDHVSALVIKPTLLGFGRAHQFVRLARERKIPIVISSSFEGPVGISFLAQMAAVANRLDVAAGLGTLDWFPPQCHLSGTECGRIDVRSVPGIEKLDQRWLSEVELGD